MISHTGDTRTRGPTSYKLSYHGWLTSVGQQPFGFARQVVDLRQDGVLQLRMIAHPGVEGANAAHGRIQAIEKLVGDARGNFGAVTEGDAVLVRHQNAAGLFDGDANGVP